MSKIVVDASLGQVVFVFTVKIYIYIYIHLWGILNYRITRN